MKEAEDSWERQRGEELYRDYKDGKIEIMSADETEELVQNLKRKGSKWWLILCFKRLLSNTQERRDEMEVWGENHALSSSAD